MPLNPRKACSAAGWMDTDYFDCMGWNDDQSGVKIQNVLEEETHNP